MADEFTTGLRARKQRLVTRARAIVPSADTKPEAQIRYRGKDDKLNSAMDSIQRSLETVQGVRGPRQDHGVTFRALDEVFQKFEQELQQGATALNNTTNTADTADQSIATHAALVNEHLDWELASQGNIHSTNYITDHTGFSNIGTNTHAQIDTHIALTNEHIDWTLTNAQNIHADNYTDTGDTTDHTAFSNIGTNTHAQIDTHIALTNEHIDWTSATVALVATTLSSSVMKTGATQVAAGAAAGELWATASHATLPDNVVMLGV